MKNTLLMIALSALAFISCAQKQFVTVSGIVTDAQSLQPLPGVSVLIKGTTKGTVTNAAGMYSIEANTTNTLIFTFIGYKLLERKIGKDSVINVALKADNNVLSEVVVTGYEKHRTSKMAAAADMVSMPAPAMMMYDREMNTEEYKSLNENIFHTTKQNPLTTFSIDVDRAAYSNVRRFLNMGQMPPKDAIRIEEMINYFDYDYPQPTGQDPVSISTEFSDSPWNKGLKLMHIGLQAKTVATDNLPASNLVFLIDVSGSMGSPNKLPLLKQAFKLLVDQLRPNDHVAITVYAGAAGLVLPSTSGNQKQTIKDALDRLEAGGSTAGSAGIKLAYQTATEHFIKGGNNRVILATDGDFNVGTSSESELQELVEDKRKSGVFLSVLGFGMGNYKDNKMETLADKGNGNYGYIDNLQEAQKTFVKEFGGTLFTVAKDVKLQLEFNPKYVKAYRLIGYENRMLKNEDFHDDKKDAGEMGAGHTVTALYEIIPANVESEYLAKIDELKYQKSTEPTKVSSSNEVVTIKLRYKEPDVDISKLMQQIVLDKHTELASTSANFRFSAAVAELGLMMRNSEFKGNASYQQIITLAENAKGKDSDGYRAEFVRLVKLAQSLDGKNKFANK